MNNSKTGVALIVIALVAAGALYFMNRTTPGPQNPSGSGGSGSGAPGSGGSGTGCGSTICLGTSSDGSDEGVAISPGTQTEAAYNVDPTDMSDAFGAGENDDGSDPVFV